MKLAWRILSYPRGKVGNVPNVSPGNLPAGSLTDRHRADPIKAGGRHYTPPLLAAFVAEQGSLALGDLSTVRVLDPACGDGALLEAAAAALPSSARVDLYGFDLDSAAIEIARLRLVDMPRNCTVTVGEVDFIDAVLAEKESTESLFGKSDAIQLSARFDFVIANPPYVRTQVLGADTSSRLAADFGLTGRVDLYQAFAVAMTATLRPGGVLALLCSNRFLTTKTGTDLREMFRSFFEIVTIFDLGDTKPFEAAVLPAVVIAQRNDGGTRAFPMSSIYEVRGEVSAHSPADSMFDALTSGSEGMVTVGKLVYDVRRGIVDVADPRMPWIPTPSSDDWIARVTNAAVMSFGDVGKLRVGIKTTADKVFIRDRWDDQENMPENDLLFPLITHHVAQRWRAEPPTKQVLYPYDLTSSKRIPVSLDDWPGTAAYLSEHRARLAGRKYVSDGGRHWWEIWVPQRPSAWALPKIVCPDISADPKFFYDTTGAIVNGDCYWITVEEEQLAFLMMAVANSAFGVAYYDAVCGNRLYAGRRRYITQYVEQFPIPDPNHPASKRVVEVIRELTTAPARERLRELEDSVDRLVRESFGLKEFSG
jgi:adenine-specific DNA-methyltransferase